MHKKYFFFDIDGTLTKSAENSEIPVETYATIDALRKAGHFVAIATGRAHCMAKFAMEYTGIYNMVCDGGQGICLDGKLLGIEPMDRKRCLEICQECLEKGFLFSVVDGDSFEYHTRDERFVEMASTPLSPMVGCVDPDFDFNHIQNFHKIFVLLDKEHEHLLSSKALLPYLRFYENGIVFEPADKFSGIRRVMEHFNAPIEDVVVFGDGKNDIGMFKDAPFSIAMGNAIDELKSIANYVTDQSDCDGIGKACRHFGWIE